MEGYYTSQVGSNMLAQLGKVHTASWPWCIRGCGRLASLPLHVITSQACVPLCHPAATCWATMHQFTLKHSFQRATQQKYFTQPFHCQPLNPAPDPGLHKVLSACQPSHCSPLLSAQGFLIPDYHKAYWMGMTSATTAPQADFKLMDPYAKPGKTVYKHWGTMQPGNIPEPNNRMGGEFCATGNYSQSYANAWGWSDTKCGERFPSICIVRRE